MSFPYSAASRRQSLSRSAGLSMAAAAVFAVSVSPAAGAGRGCKGDACRVLEPFGLTLAAAGPSCRSWLTQNFWRRARARDVRTCLARGAQVRARGGGGPLHLAAAAGNAAGVKLLLAAGARVDRPTRGGMTALQFAAATRSASAQRRQATVKALLAAGARTGARANKGRWTALHMAAIQGHAGVVKILLAAGADTRLRDRRGRTPLQAAQAARQRRTAQLLASAGRRPNRAATARLGRPDCRGWLTAGFWRRAGTADVRRCLAAGSRVDARTGRGSTPLHWAAYVNNAAAVKALVAAGAKVDARDARNRTPAHSAASGGAEAAVRALIAAGADVSARSADGRTPADEARSKGRTRIAGLLGASGGRTATAARPPKPADGGSPGKIAEKKRNAGARTKTAAPPAKTVEVRRSAGDPGPNCRSWQHPEFWKRATAADVQRCLSGGKKLSFNQMVRNFSAVLRGIRALHMAAFYGRPEAIQALIDAGAEVNSLSPAMTICGKCKFKFHGEETEYSGKFQMRALHLAVLNGKTGNVETLAAAGADVTVRDEYQLNPLDLAKASGKAGIAEILSDALQKQYERMRSVAQDCGNWMKSDFWKYGSAADVKRCVRAGRKVSARDKGGATRLHYAAYFGKVEMMKVLISSGARIEARRADGQTPLHNAARWGTPGAVDVLLDAKANAKAKTRDGKFPFDLAKKHNKRVQGTDAYWRLNEALHE